MGGADFVCLYTRTIKLNGNRMIDCDLYNLLAAVLQIFGEIICLLLGEVALQKFKNFLGKIDIAHILIHR